MNTTANFQVYPTPHAFGKHTKEFRDFILRGGKKIISQHFIELDPAGKDKLKKKIIGVIFSVEIIGDVDLSNMNLKHCLKGIFNNIDGGCTIPFSVKNSIIENLNTRAAAEVIQQVGENETWNCR